MLFESYFPFSADLRDEEESSWSYASRMYKSPDNLEIEIKFFVEDPQQMHQRLATIGAEKHSEIFETNVCFDNSEHALKSQGKLLRLRQDKSYRLTYKSPPPHDDPEYKVFNELEIEVSDFNTTADILQALGYHPVQTYEKKRRTFKWEAVELCMDIMPFGTFLEIEGPKEKIKAAVRQLGLNWNDRILVTYLAIFEALRNRFNLPFSDITFADFKRHPVDIGPLLPALRQNEKIDQRSGLKI